MWQTIFDVRDDEVRQWGALLSLLVFLSLAGLAYVPLYLSPGRRRRLWDWLNKLPSSASNRLFALMVLPALMVFYCLCIFLKLSLHYVVAYADLSAGTYQVVEGRVHHYVPKRFAKDRDESFDVNGVAFVYAGTDDAIGYNTTFYQGSPIREGSLVRIAYTGNFILRLQIAP